MSAVKNTYNALEHLLVILQPDYEKCSVQLSRTKSIVELRIKEVPVYYYVNTRRREPRNWQYLTPQGLVAW
jgi:hypothetical protein